MLHSQVLVDCRIAVARHQGNHRAEGQQAGGDVVQDPVFVAAAAESHAGEGGVERRGAGRGDQLRHAAEQVAGLVAGVEHPPAGRGVGRDDSCEDEDRLLEPALGVLVLVYKFCAAASLMRLRKKRQKGAAADDVMTADDTYIMENMPATVGEDSDVPSTATAEMSGYPLPCLLNDIGGGRVPASAWLRR